MGLSRKDRDAIVESLWLDRDQDRTPSPILQDILRPEFYTTAVIAGAPSGSFGRGRQRIQG